MIRRFRLRPSGGLRGLRANMRSNMLEVIGQDYYHDGTVQAASERAVIYKHALRNAMLPVITLLPSFGPGAHRRQRHLRDDISIPGMGQLFHTAVMSRDYPVVMGILVIAPCSRSSGPAGRCVLCAG